MKLNQLGKLAIALSLAASLQTFISAPATSKDMYKIVALTSNNTLVSYDSMSRRPHQAMSIKGVDGNVVGIDYRPANGMLYAITDTDKIYTVNSNNGVAKLVSTLSISFNGGFQAGVDFNPVADRLRVVANNGQNYRINVETGEVTADKTLNYNPTQGMGITAAAYTNSKAGATATKLYNLDYSSNTLVMQNPPNDGMLSTVGVLKMNLPPIAGFDIVTDSKGDNFGFIVSGQSLYTVDLATGTAKMMGNFREGNLIGVAVSLSSN
ncbi:MAG: DUF4394 domain-containing protein [Chroococcus sp. CMT-3BRIN-NPC107]|jgi:hypothetical protein|nr:DUF4394 domain-containing protein [Chroococcus sp. CMT-3BRIN-NPC107]